MGKIMEAIFCIVYIVYAIIFGILNLKKTNKNIEFILFGVMTLVLVFGDSFHLIPRIIQAIDKTGDYNVSLGIGKLITSVTMTLFYCLLYFIYEIRYKFKNKPLRYIFLCLALVRIVLCFLPQNDWTGSAPVLWGIIRNIPFVIMGIIIAVLFFLKRKDKPYKLMWLAITLSFLFYIPVVLWADVHPLIGMLMLPKTIMYMWIVFIGYRVTNKNLTYLD